MASLTSTSRRAALGTVHVARALNAIRMRHSDPRLNLRQIAAEIRLSPFHLSRLIKHETRVGFVHHLRVARASQAAHLLATTMLSVKEVAAAVGYARTNELDRNFKGVFGVTPTVFRTIDVAGQQIMIDRKNRAAFCVAAADDAH